MAEQEHLKTVINEGNGFSVICSCGWRNGAAFEEEMSADIAHSMHVQREEPDDYA